MRIDATSLPVLNACVDKLTKQLIDAKEELQRLQKIEGAGLGKRLHRMVKLSERIDSIRVRLERAEMLQEQALAGDQ